MKLRYVLPVLLTLMCVSTFSLAQLDARERYGTLLGGGVASYRNLDCYPGCPDKNSPATTTAQGVAVDSSGNIYAAGATNAIDFPTTTGAYKTTVNFNCDHYSDCTSNDTFLIKFNSLGQRVWSTYLGRSGQSGIRAVSIDSSGNVVVVGAATPPGEFPEFCGDQPFILKFSSGGSLIYSNFLPDECGGSGGFEVFGAAVDTSGRYAYIVGPDNDGIFPPTPGANPDPGGCCVHNRLIKIDTLQSTNNGIVYIASTNGQPNAVTVNSQGNAFVLSFDTRVTKFTAVGAVIFSVNYLPSFANNEYGAAIITTNTGDVIFTGYVGPEGAYPATASFGHLDNSPGGRDGIVVRLSGTTGTRVYSAAIHDFTMWPYALARNSADEAFVTGQSGSVFYVNRYSNAPALGGFLLRLNSTGTSLSLDSTFGGDTGIGIAIDKAWNSYVVGYSNSGEYFPLTTNAFQSSFKGARSQGFLSKLIIEADVKMLIQGASPNPVNHGSNLTYTLAVFNNGPDVSDGDTITDVLPAGTTFVSFSTTNGTCIHPAVGSGGTFKCTRTGILNKGSYWGPVKLTVHVNASSGSTVRNTASVAAKTQDVVSSNNSATVSVHVQ
jgi:uncharacterized repeat protein (TIGR01451 family)